MIGQEIAPSDRSGGATTSHTVMIPALTTLLNAIDHQADSAVYERAVLEQNVLGKGTAGSRKRTLRHLRELYLLRGDSILFRALRDLWTDGRTGQPLLAGLCALARDPVFRASASVILAAGSGDEVAGTDLSEAVEKEFPAVYNESTLAKIGRNTWSSWEQTGHLVAVARTARVRQRPICTPAATAYALMLGHLQGVRGAALFDTIWARVLGHAEHDLVELAMVASQRALIDFRHSGGVTHVGFTELLRPVQGQLL